MTRLALVRVPDDAPPPAGLIGWYTTRAPRRYAVVTDLTAWTAWVQEHAPEGMSTCQHATQTQRGKVAGKRKRKVVTHQCGHIERSFESHVRKWLAASGSWPGTEGDMVPDGMEARTDSAVRIHVTTPDGSIDSWESPVDVTPEAVST